MLMRSGHPELNVCARRLGKRRRGTREIDISVRGGRKCVGGVRRMIKKEEEGKKERKGVSFD